MSGSQLNPVPPGVNGGSPLIDFEKVSISFGRQTVFEDVTFSVKRGETKVLLGETGTGKTVLLKLALGLMKPDKGRIDVLQAEVERMPERELFELRRHIGIVFQESALFDSLSVRENVAYRLQEEGRLDEDAIEARVRACLGFVELEDVIDKMPDELSGGMRRRVSIARALATQPEIMLYDSPTGGLDPITASTIMELIIKLRDVNQVTALLVTQRLQDAYMLAAKAWDPLRNKIRHAWPNENKTSFLILHEHHVIFDGTVAELRQIHDPYVRTFLQLPA